MQDKLRDSVLTLALALLACKGLSKGKSEETQASSTPVTAPAPASDVAFKRLVPKPGTKASAKRSVSMKFTYQGKVYRDASTLDAVFEVTSSDAFRVTKGTLDVKELYTVKQEGGGAEKKSVSPLAGSRYVVTRSDDGKLGALDDNGAKVAPSQVTLLKDEFGSAFEKNETGAFLPDRRVKIGEKLSPSSDSVLKMLEIKDDGKTLIDGTEFILQSVTPDRASFDVTMTMTQKIATGVRLRSKLKGKIDIVPTGTWLVAVDLKGPLTLLDATGTEKGTGDLAVSLTQTYD